MSRAVALALRLIARFRVLMTKLHPIDDVCPSISEDECPLVFPIELSGAFSHPRKESRNANLHSSSLIQMSRAVVRALRLITRSRVPPMKLHSIDVVRPSIGEDQCRLVFPIDPPADRSFHHPACRLARNHHRSCLPTACLDGRAVASRHDSGKTRSFAETSRRRSTAWPR